MYKAIDYFTNEIIIVSENKEEVKNAMKIWIENNPDACIVVLRDEEMIYP